VDITVGTELYFTDKGWDCHGFTSGESVVRYTASAALSPGTVQAFEKDNESTGLEWEIESGTFELSGDNGDQIIVFQGTIDNPTLIFAFDTTESWERCDEVAANQHRHSAIPDGLVDGVSAVSFKHEDTFWYPSWHSTSATLPTLKQWMLNPSRFVATSSSSRRKEEYHVPSHFTILAGQMGVTGYTEYIAGGAPCVIVSSHGGDLRPASIEDRNNGCWSGGQCNWEKDCSNPSSSLCSASTANDDYTQDMARRVVDIFEGFTGCRCHLVVTRLARIKLDPNREEKEAAQHDETAISAYREFHNFIETARRNITDDCGRGGIVIDIHGHTHPEARIELGYRLSASQLRKEDDDIDDLAYTSSIKNLPLISGNRLSAIIRGVVDENGTGGSMGALFELPTSSNSTGYESVPSPRVRFPLSGEKYFQGGYITDRHGSQHDDGIIDAVQIEFPRYLRADHWEMQNDLLESFGTRVLPEFLKLQYKINNPCDCDER